MKTKISSLLALFLFLTLFFPSFLSAQVPAYVPTNGLVGYWPFNGNANDESGNGNHGTVNGATLTTDRNGNANSAFSFDGVDDFIQAFNTLTGNEEITMIVWAKLTSDHAGQFVHLGLDQVGCPCNGIGLGYGGSQSNNSGSNLLGLSSGINWINTNYSIDISGTWQMFTLIKDVNNNFNFYSNGQLVFSSSSSINSASNSIFFGSASPTYSLLQGSLDDIAIYNRALTPEEITALYNGTTNTSIAGCTNNTACNYNAAATQDDGSCSFPVQTYLNCAGTCINDTDNDGTCDELENPTLPSYLPSNGLVGYWPFNGNANDESGNGNHGTVNGATLTSDRNGNANSAYGFDKNEIQNIVVNSSSSLESCYNMSIVLWVKINSSTVGNYNRYLNKGNGNDGYQFVFANQWEGIYLYHNADFFQTATLPTNGSWQMLTITYNYSLGGVSNFCKLYLNGQLNNSFVTTTGINPNSQLLTFGSEVGSPNSTPDGILDDIAIYNRALTQEEITALYNGTTAGGGGGNGGTAGTPAPSVPQGIPYQAMIRDNNGAALVNTPVTVRFSLRQDAIDGTVEYQETHNLSTNAFGLVNTHFGSGTATQGTFANINWSNTTKFIQVEANSGGGFVEMGTQQMMSVPFALQSNKATAIKNAGLPVYANNAAALAGGLVAGDMYRTAAGILMIVY